MEIIAGKYLRQLQDRAETAGTQLLIPQELAAWLGRRCKGKDGARNLRRLVQNEVEAPLASFLLHSAHKPGKVKIRLENEKVVI